MTKFRHLPDFSRRTPEHRKLYSLTIVLGLSVMLMGCLWQSVGRWIFLGALLVLLPLWWTSLSRVLDVELVQDRLTRAMPGPRPPYGRHHGETFLRDESSDPE